MVRRNAIVTLLCLAAAIPAAGCQFGGMHTGNFNVDAYVPEVTVIAKAATVNLLKNAGADKIKAAGDAAAVSAVLANGGIKLDPNLAQSQIRAMIEKSAPAIAADKGIMSIVEVAVSLAVGQVEHIANTYGPKFDQSNATVKLIQAALTGVKQGTDALLMPGGPPPIPG